MARHAKRPERPRLGGELWVDCGAERVAGAARMALLRAVADGGSLTRAAQAVGLSYKGAWDAIEGMNRAAGQPLVERSAGGRGGGSTRLTEPGRLLLDRYEQVAAVHQRLLQLLDEEAFDLQAEVSPTRWMILKTSARNQFNGRVTAIRAGAVNDEVEISVDHGPRVVATVTRDSTDALGLRLNMPAVALVKASSVMLAADVDGMRLSARNQFAGVVRQVQPGAVNSEVTLDLDVGGSVTAIVTQSSVQAMGLTAGGRATAFFKAGSVIVAVSA